MFNRRKQNNESFVAPGGLLKTACLGLVSIALLCSAQRAQAEGKAEHDLVNQINQYRVQNGLSAIPLSHKMTTVAVAHVEDLVKNEPHKKLCPADPDKQNGHSWSHNPGKWKGGCYDRENQATYPIMWDKPKEITGYPTYGYEIFTQESSAKGALQSWKDSAPHNDVILNKNMWSDHSWKAIGAASYQGYYVVWFGKTLDDSKAPSKIAHLKDHDKPKTVDSMIAVLAIDPARLEAAKAKSASKETGADKGDAPKIVPSGSRVSEGVHGRVYALDESGKIIGNVSGATIEVKNQAGAVVATVTSVKNGYYKADLSPGQYFYKVTAPGYKDEDKGRGFTLQRNDRGHIYDFWLVKGPNDPNKLPPEIPTVEIGDLKGHVWEKTAEGTLLAIPQAAISLRRNDSAQLTKVLTSGGENDEELAGVYKVVLQTGSWRASVQAPGFKILVDPESIAIDAGKETIRDFILQRHTRKPPANQGIKGIVRVHGSRLGQLPADLTVEIKPVASETSNLDAVVVDSTGGFRQELLPGSYRVHASASGYRTADSGVKFVFLGKYTMVDLLLVAAQTPEQPEEPDKPDETDKPTEIRLMLTVVEDSKRGQQPLPGAKLLVRISNQDLDEAQRGTADENGKAEFLLGQPGHYVALAQAEGFKPSGIRLEVTPNANLSRTITLSRSESIEQDSGQGDEHGEEVEPAKVSGYLVRRDKKSPTGAFGVPGATLTWNRIGGLGGPPQRVSTGTVGNFDLVLPEGDYRIGFDLPQGYQPKAPELVKVRVGMDKNWFYALEAPQRVPDDGGSRPLDPIRPEEPEQVELDVRGAVVVQSAGAPGGYAGVPGAVVRWHPPSGSRAQPETALSGRGGAFSLRLGTGVYTVEVMPPSGYQGTKKVVRVHPGMERTLLMLGRAATTPGDTGKPPEEPGNLTLTLQVFGRDGRRAFPLGAAQIQISGRQQIFMTDTGGRLSVPLPAGTYNVTATKSGYNMARREVVLSGRNAVVPPIYLDRQPTGGGGELKPPGDGQTPPPPQKAPLQIRVMVTFPKPAKNGQPAGSTTLPAKGASIRIMHGRQQVFAGRADDNGYLGAHLPPGDYQIQVMHGTLNHNEGVTIGKQLVRRIITLQSGAALIAPEPGSAKPIPRIPNRGPLIPNVPLQRRVL